MKDRSCPCKANTILVRVRQFTPYSFGKPTCFQTLTKMLAASVTFLFLHMTLSLTAAQSPPLYRIVGLPSEAYTESVSFFFRTVNLFALAQSKSTPFWPWQPL